MKKLQSLFSTLVPRWANSRKRFDYAASPLPMEPTRKAEQMAAHQEWEGEGGAVKTPRS